MADSLTLILFDLAVRQGIKPVLREEFLSRITAKNILATLQVSDAGPSVSWRDVQRRDPRAFHLSMLWLFFDCDYMFYPGVFLEMTLQDVFGVMLYAGSCTSQFVVALGDAPLIVEKRKIIDEVDSSSDDDDDVDSYIDDLSDAQHCHVLTQDYSSYDTNGRAFVRRLPVIMQIVQQLPESEIVFAPCDGIGVVALACRQLRRKCVTYESYGIGKRAVKLGLIKNNLSYDAALSVIPDGSIVILSNLARYYDLGAAIDRFRCVVLDEQLTYNGFTKLMEVLYTGGRLRCHASLNLSCIMCGPVIPLTFDRFVDKTVKYVTDDSKLLYQMPKFGYDVRPTKTSRVAAELGGGCEGVLLGRVASIDVPPDTFMVDYRKTASSRCGRKGQRQLIGRDWFQFDLAERVIPLENGFKKSKDVNFLSKVVLYGVSVPETDSFELTTTFNPTKIKFVCVSGLNVRVVVSNVKLKAGRYHSVVRRLYQRYGEAFQEKDGT